MIVTLILASISLWPSIMGSQDGHKAMNLAIWTAEKEFNEWCENHQWPGETCQGA
jgi:hypothetical protein